MATDTARSAQPLDHSRRRLTLVAMCIGQGMILLDNTIVNVALPAIQRGLGVTPGNLEWTVNAYVLALASLIILGGTLGDRYGRKRLYLIGLVVFTIFSAACGLASRDVALIVCRGLQGVGAALMAPLTLSILVDAYPPEERTTAIGIWASVAGLGFGMGPIVGGLLIGQFGWPAVFWVNVPIGIAGFALALAAVRESRDPGARALDPVGNVLVSGGLFLLTFALIETNVHPWLSPYTLSLGALALVLLVAFLVHEARTAHPMVPLGLFKDRVFSSANALYMLAYAALAGMFFFVTLYFQNVKGWSAVRTGMSWIPLNALFLAIAPFAGRLVKRYGMARTVSAASSSPASERSGSGGSTWSRRTRPRGRGICCRPRLRHARPRGVVGGDVRRPRRSLGRRLRHPQFLAPGRRGAGPRRARLAQRRRRLARVAGEPRHPPEAARARAAALVQQVAGGEGPASRPPSGPPRSPRHSTPSSPATAWRSSSPASSSSSGPPSPSPACAPGSPVETRETRHPALSCARSPHRRHHLFILQ